MHTVQTPTAHVETAAEVLGTCSTRTLALLHGLTYYEAIFISVSQQQAVAVDRGGGGDRGSQVKKDFVGYCGLSLLFTYI